MVKGFKKTCTKVNLCTNVNQDIDRLAAYKKGGFSSPPIRIVQDKRVLYLLSSNIVLFNNSKVRVNQRFLFHSFGASVYGFLQPVYLDTYSTLFLLLN